MITAYEATYIIPPDTSEEQMTTVIEKYRALITKNEGTIDDLDRWPIRKLAYEIKAYRDGANRKYREGIYVIMNFQGEPACKNELDRIFRISDDVIRFMITKQDPKADRFPSQGPLAGGGPIRVPTRYNRQMAEANEMSEGSEGSESRETSDSNEAPVAEVAETVSEVAESTPEVAESAE
jgi:small subunit ribosomal protein S6